MIARFINPLLQFGKKEYELIILDGEEIMDRRHVGFDEKATDEDMEEFASSVITELSVKVEEINIDKPTEKEEE